MSHIGRASVLAGIAAMAAAGAAIAQPCTENCGGEIKAQLCPSATWIPGTMSWTPNRDPAKVIMLTTGAHTANPRGQDWRWYDMDDFPTYGGNPVARRDCDNDTIPDVFNFLLDELNLAVSQGFTRIILYVPAGQPQGQTLLSMAQWGGMPLWKQEGFEDYILPWMAYNSDISLGVYLNFDISDANSICQGPGMHAGTNPSPPWPLTCSTYRYPPDLASVPSSYYYYCGSGQPAPRIPDPTDEDDICLFHETIDPWIRIMDFNEFWFDHSAQVPRRDNFLEFRYNPDYAGVSFVGESIPSDDTTTCLSKPGYTRLDHGAMLTAPFVCFATAMYEREIVQSCDGPQHSDAYDECASSPRWTFGFNNTEAIFVVCYDNNLVADTYRSTDWSLDELWDRAHNGWVLSALSDSSSVQYIEYMKRIYDFGTIKRGDLNADGVVDSADEARLWDLLTLYNETVDRNYIHGDINNDSFVNMDDWDEFQLNGNAMIDLETPDPSLVKR